MPQQVSIDDTNSTLIQYTGSWEPLIGSTRQWEGTTHGTTDPRASATFSFRGYQVWIWGTVPAGTGSISYNISVDGGVINTTTLTLNGPAIYNDIYYQSPALLDTYHTIVIHNLGSSANGNAELQLDRFVFQTDDEIPSFAPPADVTTAGISSSSTATFFSPTSTPGIQSTTTRSSSSSRIGTIAGAVIGVLAAIIIILFFFLWKLRNSRKMKAQGNSTGRHQSTSLAAIPYPMVAGQSSSVSEKARSNHQVELESTTRINAPLIRGARTTVGPSPDHQASLEVNHGTVTVEDDMLLGQSPPAYTVAAFLRDEIPEPGRRTSGSADKVFFIVIRHNGNDGCFKDVDELSKDGTLTRLLPCRPVNPHRSKNWGISDASSITNSV